MDSLLSRRRHPCAFNISIHRLTNESLTNMLAHNVYFTLLDPSDDAVENLVQQCEKYLKNHPGVVFFAAGKLEVELARPVNDRMFDVALHVVFETREAHDAYQIAEAHQRFIEENKATWKQVRVFDSSC